MATTSTPTGTDDRPGFDTERLALDVETARDVVCDALAGVTATETEEGIAFRTTDGTLLAVLKGADAEEPAVELQYRTAPASATATLKARRLRRALDPHAT